MSTCTKCGAELPEGTTFCEKCDVPAEQEPAPTVETPQEEVPQTETAPVFENTASVNNEQPKKKKVIIPAIIALVLVVAIVLGIVFIGGKNKVQNYTMYIKDNALYYTSLDEVAPVKVDDEVFVESDDFWGNLVKSSGLSGLVVSASSELLSDNKTLVYPQKISGDLTGSNIFLKDIKAEDAQEVKVDSDISNFKITEDEKVIIYWKADNEFYDFYQYNIEAKTKEKIIDNADYYFVNEDVTKILYTNEDKGLYIYDIFTEGEKKDKVDSDVLSVFYKNDDFSVIRYMKENEIYEKKAGEDKKKIARDVHSVICSYETGETYFLKLEKESIPYSDLFTDDMKDKDKGKTVKDEQRMYRDSKWPVYQEWYAKNHSSVRRDYFRKAIKDQKIEREIFSLHYINGDEQKKLADNLSVDQFGFSYTYASEKPVLVFNTFDESVMKKLKMSDMDYGTSRYDDYLGEWVYTKEDVEVYTIFTETVEKNYIDANSLKVVVGNTVSDIDEDTAFEIEVASDGSAVYYIDNINFEKEEPKENRDYDEEWSEDIYYFKNDVFYLNPADWGEALDIILKGDAIALRISDGVVANNETVDNDVSLYGIRIEEDNTSLTYFKNYNGETGIGDYYVNGKEIAYDVKGASVLFKSPKEIYYITEYDDEEQMGDLKLYNGKENTLIANDVYHYEVTNADEILFITDYSEKNNYGSLYLVGKKENILIDYDVTSIVSNKEPTSYLFNNLDSALDFDIEVDDED